MTIDEKILKYLYFGYVPRKLFDLARYKVGNKINNLSEDELIDLGIKKLNSVFNNISDNTHIIPLSGGLDSRAILAVLLDKGLKNYIETVTFGTPGTWDYEIGNLVAKKSKVNHHKFDLTKIKITQEGLLKSVKEEGAAWTWLFDSYYNRLVYNNFGHDVCYWTGFMGDNLVGSHLQREDNTNWNVALYHFCRKNIFSKSMSLIPVNYSPIRNLPKNPLLDLNIMGYDEQLDLAIRQKYSIKPLILAPGYKYKIPFLDPGWVKFSLNIPRKYRYNQYLYKEILKKAYPNLFSLPTKTNLGLPLDAPKWQRELRRFKLRARSALNRFFPGGHWGINPMVNYIDFDRGLRERKDLKTVVYENIQDLKNRKIVEWIDIDNIWKRHQNKIANHADALILLASLEINLKAEDEKK